MKLYEFDVSRSLRAHWVLREAGARYETVTIDLTKGDQHSPEFLAVNPYGKLPVLEDDGEIITESAAICTYIAEKYPEKGLIPPTGDIDRAHYFQWICFCIAEMEPHLWLIRKHMILYPRKDRSLDAIRIEKKEYKTAASVLATHMQDRVYIVGDSFTAADIVVCYDLFWANSLKLLEEYPILVSYMYRMQERAAYPVELLSIKPGGLVY